jgi:hypothetical protein
VNQQPDFLFISPPREYAGICEEKVAFVAAVRVHAARSAVALAGVVPTEFQRVLCPGFLRRGIFSTRN